MKLSKLMVDLSLAIVREIICTTGNGVGALVVGISGNLISKHLARKNATNEPKFNP